MNIQSPFSLTGIVFKAAVTGTAAAATVRWSGHLVQWIHHLQTTPLSVAGTVAGVVMMVSALTDAVAQKFLMGAFKLKNELALEFFGTAAGLMTGYASTWLMQYEILPLSLSAGSPLVVLGSTGFLLWKLSQIKEAYDEQEAKKLIKKQYEIIQAKEQRIKDLQVSYELKIKSQDKQIEDQKNK